MAVYKSVLYNEAKYGAQSRLSFSVEPISAVALDYAQVKISWNLPVGGYTGFRLVRSQDGFPETAEDGIILYEQFGINSSGGVASKSSFIDGVDTTSHYYSSLVEGKYAYYRVWLLRTSEIDSVSSVWYEAGDAYTLIPSQHPTTDVDGTSFLTTHDKIMGLLPRVYTSTSQSPLDEVDPSSDLFKYLKGFSFTIDELLTFADNLIPENTGKTLNPSLLFLKAYELGVTQEPGIATKNQKRVIREAIYNYQHKGTLAGVRTFAESLTGYNCEIQISPNLFLNVENSTFYKGVGYWISEGDVAITLEDAVIPTSENNSIDTAYCAKVVVGTAGASVSNGADYPVTRGIPVTAGGSYTLSYYAKTASGTADHTPSISWYDYKGTLIRTDTAGAATTASTTWGQASLTKTAPGYSSPVTTAKLTSNVVTLGVSDQHTFVTGDSVIISGVGSPFDGTVSLSGTTTSTISYAVTNADIPIDYVYGTANKNETDAVYASVNVSFGSATTYYLDMFQLSSSSVTDYSEARAVNIYLSPTKYNHIKNPSFEYDSSITGTGWAVTPSGGVSLPANTSGGSYIGPYGVLTGSKLLQLVTNTGSVSSVVATTDKTLKATGETYCFSIYGKATSGSHDYSLSLSAVTDLVVYTASLTSNVATLTLNYGHPIGIGDTIVVSGISSVYNGTFTVTAVTPSSVSYAKTNTDVALANVTGQVEYTITNTSSTITLNTSWNRIYGTIYVPPSFVASQTFLKASISATTSGETIQFDGAQFEMSYYPTDYFDGSYGSERGGFWGSTADNSYSFYYPNKIINVNRLINEIPGYFPFDTPYVIISDATTEDKEIV